MNEACVWVWRLLLLLFVMSIDGQIRAFIKLKKDGHQDGY